MSVRLQWVSVFLTAVIMMLDVVCDKIYRKITEKAENLVKVGESNRIGLRHSDCQ